MGLWQRLPLGVQLVFGMGVPYGSIVGLMVLVMTGSTVIICAPALWLVLPFGNAMGFMMLLMTGSAVVAGISALCSGGLFGVSMAVFGTLGQTLGVTQLGRRTLSSSSSVVQRARVMLSGDREAVFAKARAVFMAFGAASIDRDDPAHGVIEGFTKASLWSMGERVCISVSEAGGQCEVVIISRPWLPTTLVDFGVNARNVARLQAALVALEEVDARDAGAVLSRVVEAARALSVQAQ
jgi:hypothetical protein